MCALGSLNAMAYNVDLAVYPAEVCAFGVRFDPRRQSAARRLANPSESEA